MTCERCIGGLVIGESCVNCGWAGWPSSDRERIEREISERVAASVRKAQEEQRAYRESRAWARPAPVQREAVTVRRVAPTEPTEGGRDLALANLRRAAMGLPPLKRLFQ